MSAVQTSWSRDRISLRRFVPMKPRPPVINTLLMSVIYLSRVAIRLPRPIHQNIGNSGGSLAISVRICDRCHPSSFVNIGEESGERTSNTFTVDADQQRVAGVNALGTLGRFPHHQDRLAERGRFLLNTATI